MTKEEFPIRAKVQRLCDLSLDPSLLDRFREHAEPLRIEAKGDVLIIGPGDLLEEVALIEQDLVSDKVSTIQVIGNHPITAENFQTIWPNNYPPISFNGISYGSFFDSNPGAMFDTILFIGTPMAFPALSIGYLSEHLNSAGKLYATINGEMPSSLEIPECKLEIIPNLPANPNYNALPEYYGVVAEK